MIGKKAVLKQILPLADLILVLGCAYIAPAVTNLIAPYLAWETNPGFNVFTASPFMVGAAVAAVPLILRIVGFYHRLNKQRISSAIRQLFAFCLYCLGIFGFYQIIRVNEISVYMNHVILVSLLLTVPALFLRFYLIHIVLVYTGIGRRHMREVLLAGSEKSIAAGWEALPRYWRHHLKVVGRVIAGRTTPQEVQQMIEQNHVQQLMLFAGICADRNLAEAVTLCELQGIDIYVQVEKNTAINMRAEVSDVGDCRMLILTSSPVYSWMMTFKSLFDKIAALLGIILTSPLWLIAAIGIKISDPHGKIFYRQQRSGLYGKPFGMWKFRSMYSDADKRLDEIKATYGNEMSGPIFKLTNDPRIFPFGHFIRKTSIDELPQLLNVLVGDMSVVGPRPLPTYETAAFPEISQRRRLCVKPGITCYWQIEDRSNTAEFETLVQKDLKYIDNWSLWMDFVLILRTIPAVLFRRGAK